MLAAGGTGGHLFPAFALAEELMRRGYEVDLVTDMRGDRYGTGFPARTVHRVPSATLKGRNPLALLRTMATLAWGLAASLALLRRVRPGAVIGFGGYPILPPLMAARLLGVPTALHEQNAVMGRANRLMASRVGAVALSFDAVKRLPEKARKTALFTGNPVRDDVIDWSGRPYQPPGGEGALRLLVFGGSQGARVFSDMVPDALVRLPSHLRARLAVVQQCRQEDLVRVEAAYAQAGIAAEVAPFFRDLPARIVAAHLVIARSGASTVAELAVLGRPAILVPLPHALDNDQLENATRLEEAGGAWCIPQPDLTRERLATEIGRLFADPQSLSAAAEAARHVGRPGAVRSLADVAESVVRRRDS